MNCGNRKIKYCKIPKISPGAYIFQRPFLRGLFFEGLIFGGAYVRREIYVIGDLTEGFLRYEFGGLVFGGAYTWRGLFLEFYGIAIQYHILSILLLKCYC